MPTGVNALSLLAFERLKIWQEAEDNMLSGDKRPFFSDTQCTDKKKISVELQAFSTDVNSQLPMPFSKTIINVKCKLYCY